MNAAPLSRFFLALLLSLLALLFVAALFPLSSGEIFQGKATLEIDPSLLGSMQLSFPDQDWGWRVFLPLPLSVEITALARSLNPGALFPFLWPLVIFVLLSALAASLLGAFVGGLRFALLSLLASCVVFFFALLGAGGAFLLLGPEGINDESEAVFSLSRDFQKPLREPTQVYIPGQELILPESPFYGGRVVCKGPRCILESAYP